jgi:proteic killer suppression protein
MEIESISHKALKRFFFTGNSKGLTGDVERLRAMLAFIAAAASLEELARPPNYGLHRLTGNRAGTNGYRE